MKQKKNIVAVITAPDKPAGRGLQMHASPVKKFALENGIPVLQPAKLKDPEFLIQLKNYQADLQIVVAFRMLPEVVWNMPPHGTFNLHASLLPQYRGAAPINHAIMNGETITGVTTFFLQQEIDTGKIILQQKVEIKPNESAGELHDELMIKGAGLVLQTVEELEKGSFKTADQNINQILKTAPKIFTENCRLNWEQKTETLHNQVRGLSPFPGAFTHYQNKVLKIYKSEIENIKPTEAAGSFVTDQKTFLKVATSDGYLNLLEVQPESKRRMMIADYLRGNKF